MRVLIRDSNGNTLHDPIDVETPGSIVWGVRVSTSFSGEVDMVIVTVDLADDEPTSRPSHPTLADSAATLDARDHYAPDAHLDLEMEDRLGGGLAEPWTEEDR